MNRTHTAVLFTAALAMTAFMTACGRDGGKEEQVVPSDAQAEQTTTSDKPAEELVCGLLDGMDDEKVTHGAE